MADSASILKRLATVEDEAARAVSHWLSHEKPELLSIAPADITVNEALHVWRLRYNRATTSLQMKGGDHLLKRLNELTPQKKLEQLTFSSAKMNGNIFFEKTSGNFVGAILTRRKVAEASLGRHSELAAATR